MNHSDTQKNVGIVLLDRYKITSFLAEGGMGKVYLAMDTRLNRQVVLKFPSIDLLHKVGFRERFQKEVSTLVELDLSGVISVYDYGEHEAHPFVVLQYLSNGSLDDQLGGELGNRQKIQSLEEVLAWATPLAKTIDTLHRNGVIHRDIKPGNILFDRENSVYLSDFGIIKVLKSLEDTVSETYGAIGSPGYMAPEYINREVFNEYDQYLLATTLYESLSGRLPFKWDTPDQYRVVVATQQPVPLIENAPHISEAVSQVIMKALKPRADERYDSCQAFIKAIKQALLPQTVKSEHEAVVEKTTAVNTKPTASVKKIESNTEKPKNNKGLIVVGIALLAGIAGASYYLTGSNKSEKAVSSIASTVKTKPISTDKTIAIEEKAPEGATRNNKASYGIPPKVVEKKAPVKQALIADRYIKLDSQGQPLKNQQVSYKEQAWQCVKDVKTGLIWEVKMLEGLHNKEDTYEWKGSFIFKDKVNQKGWCGATDWGVPKIEELRTLVHCSNGTPQEEAWDDTCNGKNDSKVPYQRPTIEQQVFPNTRNLLYWSSSPYAGYAYGAWGVGFSYGYDNAYNKDNNGHVRLVRSGQ